MAMLSNDYSVSMKSIQNISRLAFHCIEFLFIHLETAISQIQRFDTYVISIDVEVVKENVDVT